MLWNKILSYSVRVCSEDPRATRRQVKSTFNIHTDDCNFSTFVRRENVEKMVGELKMQIEEENEEKTLEDKVEEEEEEEGETMWTGAPSSEQFLV